MQLKWLEDFIVLAQERSGADCMAGRLAPAAEAFWKAMAQR